MNAQVGSPLRNLSIKRKLTLVTMLTSCAALLVACVLIALYDYVTARQTLARETRTMADVVGGNTTAALSFDDREAASAILGRLRFQENIRTALILDAAGEVFAEVVNPEFPAAQCQGIRGSRFTGSGLVVVRPILFNGSLIGSICLQSDLVALNARVRRYGLILALVLVASSLAALLLSAGLQRLISGPILRLAHIARTVSTDRNYGIRADKGSDDELGRLIDDFNGMLAHIE